MAGSSDTRQRALEAALEVFSRRGYEAASMGDIAGELNIKAPSLYKYFKGKEDLFAALDPIIEEHYQGLWNGVEVELEKLERRAGEQGHVAAEQFEQAAMDWFTAELTDLRARRCRKLADRPRWLWTTPLALYEAFFTRLIAQEFLRRGDPHVMAVQLLSPLVQLLALNDFAPGQDPEPLLEEARLHLRQFHRIFAHREQRGQAQSPVGRLFRR